MQILMSILALTFPLEWNETYRTDVPYEVEVSPAKLGANTFTVRADGRALETKSFAGKRPGCTALRFTVPAGTRSLSCEGKKTKDAAVADTATIDNLFSEALRSPENWSVAKGVTVEPVEGGLRFTASSASPNHAEATYAVDVPAELVGKPVRQDIDITSNTRLVRGGNLWIEQLDANGEKLPETLADLRQTSHMRPCGKLIAYREDGFVHPQAKKLRFRMELRRLKAGFDEFGEKIEDRSLLEASFTLSKLAVRPAAQLPFPKYDDSFFGPGVSGRPGDRALRFGSANENAFFYQTHTRGVWSGAYRCRVEEECTFPMGEGTVEAWFKPDWKCYGSDRPAVLFQAYGGYSQSGWKNFVDVAIELAYAPKDGTWTLEMRDWSSRHEYKKAFAGLPGLPDGVWTHVALEWTPKGTADLFVGGRKAATLPIPEFEAVPFADKKIEPITDVWAMDFFFASAAESVRLSGKVDAKKPLFEGWGDQLRASTGRRYAGDFTPARSFAVDRATRALFGFDRTFDGVAGAGFGQVRGCLRSAADRVDHMLALSNGKPLQYWPKDIQDANDPFKIFDLNNYPTMPTAEEFDSARALRTRSFTLSHGDVAVFKTSAKSYPEYTEIVNASPSDVLRYPIPVQKGRLDPRSFADLSADLLAERRDDLSNVNRVFQFVISSTDYFTGDVIGIWPGCDDIHEARLQPLTMLNGYLGFECGPLNNLTANMFVTVAQCASSRLQGYGHEFQEVFFGGKNHVYDLSAQKFFPARDNELSADLEEIGDQPYIHARVGKECDHFMRKGLCGGGVQDPGYAEKCALTLNPGEKVRIFYRNDTRHNNLQCARVKGPSTIANRITPDSADYSELVHVNPDCGFRAIRRDRVFPHFSTAVLTFDGVPSAKNPAFDASAGDSFTYQVCSCYPIVYGEYAAKTKSGRMAALEISTDGGKTFRPLADGGDGVATLEYQVKARYAYLVRVKAPISAVTRFRAKTEGLVNPRTYPGFVKPGTNEFAFRCVPGAKAKVTFGWREPVKDIVVAGTARTGAIPGCERETVLVDPAKPLTLQVTGASAKTAVRTCGRVKASFADGRLTVAYDAAKRPAIVHGDDLPQSAGEFPAIAAVDLVDGDAVKTLTVLVAPNARLVFLDRKDFGREERTVRFAALPAGDYHVFTVGRFESDVAVETTGRIFLYDPEDVGKASRRSHRICRQMCGSANFLKAQFGQTGRRANWKWDSSFYEREYEQNSWSGWSLRSFAFPAGTDHLDFYGVPGPKNQPMEMAAVLVLPKADQEIRRDLRAVLMGLNADPFHVR